MKRILRLTLIICLIILASIFILTSCDVNGLIGSITGGDGVTDDGGNSDTPDVPDTPDNPHQHSFGEWQTVTDATCTSEGLEVRSCECGKEERKNVSPTGEHTLDENECCVHCGYSEYADDFFVFTLLDNGTYSIRAKNKTYLPTRLSIPETYNKIPVTVIEDSAFSYCHYIVSIEIPNSIIHIGYEAFRSCDSLKSVNIPSSVQYISDYAFYECSTDINSITVDESNAKYHSKDNCLIETETNKLILGCKNSIIPDYVVMVGHGAFSNCSGLLSINIPDSVLDIGLYAFSNCSSLTDLQLGENVKAIWESAFSNCSSLKNIFIPKNVEHIGVYAFEKCATSLESIVVEKDNTVYHSKDNCLIQTDTDILILGCNNSTIPSYIKEIEWSAFYGCKELTKITLPESLTTIGSFAFCGCSNLSEICLPESLIRIGAFAFGGCDKVTSLIIPSNVKSMGDGAFSDCSNLVTVVINENSQLSNSADSIFSNCFKLLEIYNLSNLNISLGSEDYGRIGYWAKIIHSSIQEPSIITRVDDFLFMTYRDVNYLVGYLGNNTNLILPDSYNESTYEIYNYAFYGNENLQNLTISGGVSAIGNSAFADCYNLSHINIKEGVTVIGSNAFASCIRIKSIDIPNSVQRIERAAFGSCIALSTLNFSKNGSLTHIGESAFSGCSSLTSVTIPQSITELGYKAFSNDNLVEVYNLSNITISYGDVCSDYGYIGFDSILIIHNQEDSTSIMNKVGDFVFFTHDGTNYLLKYLGAEANLTLPDGYNSQPYQIYDFAFYGNDAIVELTIPKGITSIGNNAFRHCSNLISVILSEDVQSIGNNAFSDCYNLTSVVLSEGLKEIGDLAFMECSKLEQINIPNSLVTVGYRAFHGCNKIRSIYKNCIYVGNNNNPYLVLTESLYKLKSYIIHNDTKLIADKAFYSNDNLQEIILSDNLVCIGSEAFWLCHNLTSITIPEKVSYVDKDAFDGCYKLIEVYNLSDLDIDKLSLIKSHTKIIHTSKEEKSVINKVGDYYFATLDGKNYLIGCFGDESELILPESYNGESYEIYERAFYNKNIKSVILTDGVTAIGLGAFLSCEKLSSITIGNNVETIRYEAFSYCTSLESVTIPHSVILIEEYAFYGCYNINSVTFENPNGWYGIDSSELYTQDFSSNDLSNPNLASSFITEDYHWYNWRRK